MQHSGGWSTLTPSLAGQGTGTGTMDVQGWANNVTATVRNKGWLWMPSPGGWTPPARLLCPPLLKPPPQVSNVAAVSPATLTASLQQISQQVLGLAAGGGQTCGSMCCLLQAGADSPRPRTPRS